MKKKLAQHNHSYENFSLLNMNGLQFITDLLFLLIGTVAVVHENIEESYAYYHNINCPESTGTSLSSCFNVGSEIPCSQVGGVICKGNLVLSQLS